METIRNWHISNISNTPGTTGDLVCSTAYSGYLTFGVADDGKTFSISISDVAGRESRTGCVYTHSTRTLTRGTLDDSTTGSAINLTSSAVVTATPLLASKLAPLFIAPQFANWFDVRGTFYGDIAAAVAALNASTYGGVLYFSAGPAFTTTGGHVITKLCTIRGEGSGDVDPQVGLTGYPNNGLSYINCTAVNVDCFIFQVDGCKVRDVTIRMTNATTPTSGSALKFSAGNGIDVDHCFLADFWCPLWVDNAQTYRVTYNCLSGGLVQAKLANTAIPDGGDVVFHGNNIYATRVGTAYGVWIVSGGGVKLTDNKFNIGYTTTGSVANVAIAIRLELTSTSPPSNTVIFLVQGNSIENTTQDTIQISRVGGGAWGQINILGNQFGNYSNGTYHAVEINSDASGCLDEVLILGNTFHGSGGSASAVFLNNIDNVVLGPNMYRGYATKLTTTGVTNMRNFDALA